MKYFISNEGNKSKAKILTANAVVFVEKKKIVLKWGTILLDDNTILHDCIQSSNGEKDDSAWVSRLSKQAEGFVSVPVEDIHWDAWLLKEEFLRTCVEKYYEVPEKITEEGQAKCKKLNINWFKIADNKYSDLKLVNGFVRIHQVDNKGITSNWEKVNKSLLKLIEGVGKDGFKNS